MKISVYQNSKYIWVSHYVLDPFIVMISLGAVGHMRHLPLLYSFGYIQVFLINAALQHIVPILVTSDSDVSLSKEVIGGTAPPLDKEKP